jgi:PAS domain S-box-containing protein
VSRGSGSTEEVFVTFSDVTHLKNTENKVKAVIDNSPHGIVEVDPGSRRLLSCNQAMAAMFGYTLEEMIGLPLDVLHPPNQLPVLAETLDGVVEDARQSLLDLPVYVPCMRNDGSLVYCRIAPGLLRLGQSATLTAFFTAVTDEFQSRRALEGSRESCCRHRRWPTLAPGSTISTATRPFGRTKPTAFGCRQRGASPSATATATP